jgi:hypothetical protein
MIDKKIKMIDEFLRDKIHVNGFNDTDFAKFTMHDYKIIFIKSGDQVGCDGCGSDATTCISYSEKYNKLFKTIICNNHDCEYAETDIFEIGKREIQDLINLLNSLKDETY